MSDFVTAAESYASAAAEYAKVSETIARTRAELVEQKDGLQQLEDFYLLGNDDDGQPMVKGANAEQRAAALRQLCRLDEGYRELQEAIRESEYLLQAIQGRQASLLNQMSLAKRQMDWHIADARQRVEVK